MERPFMHLSFCPITPDKRLSAKQILGNQAQERYSGERSLFAGLLKCGTCGKAMSRRNYGPNSKHKIFVCVTYATYGVYKCSQHKLFETDLTAAVLEDIQSKARLAMQDRELLIKKILQRTGRDSAAATGTTAAQYKRARKRLEEVNRLVERLYEDTVLGRISPENFDRMIAKYQGEQKDLTAQIEAVEQAEKAVNDTRTDAERCADLLAPHAGITELTPEILNALISRIDVHEPHEVDGMMQQDIDIHYRHAGLLEAVEFDSSTFYKSEKVKQASRQRMKPGGKTEALVMEQDKLSA